MEDRFFNGFGLSWEKKKLLDLLYTSMEKQLENESFSSGGFALRFSLQKSNEWSLQAMDKTITVKLPVMFSFTKPEGLFSVEGEGGILLELACTFCAGSGEKPYYEVELLSFEWFRSPVVNMGQIDFPVEFLADIIVRRIRDCHLDNWMRAVNERWDISGILQKLQDTYARDIPIGLKPEWYFNLEIQRWVLVGFQDNDTDINIMVYLDYGARLTDTKSSFLSRDIMHVHTPVSGLLTRNPYSFTVHGTYEGLGRMMAHYMNSHEIGGKSFDVEKITIRHTSFFEVKLLLRSPVHGTVTVTGQPSFDRNRSQLDFSDIKVDITANQFFYQLSSPLIEKMIRSRIREILPLAVQNAVDIVRENVLKKALSKSMVLQVKDLRVDDILFLANACQLQIKFDGFSVVSADHEWSVFSVG